MNPVLNKSKPLPPAPPAEAAATDKSDTAPPATEDKMETD